MRLSEIQSLIETVRALEADAGGQTVSAEVVPAIRALLFPAIYGFLEGEISDAITKSFSSVANKKVSRVREETRRLWSRAMFIRREKSSMSMAAYRNVVAELVESVCSGDLFGAPIGKSGFSINENGLRQFLEDHGIIPPASIWESWDDKVGFIASMRHSVAHKSDSLEDIGRSVTANDLARYVSIAEEFVVAIRTAAHGVIR